MFKIDGMGPGWAQGARKCVLGQGIFLFEFIGWVVNLIFVYYGTLIYRIYELLVQRNVGFLPLVVPLVPLIVPGFLSSPWFPWFP